MTNLPTRQWWLLLRGQPSGPFQTKELLKDLQFSRISTSAIVCPTDSSSWAALWTFAEFAQETVSPSMTLPGGRTSERFLAVMGWYELAGVPCLKLLVWILTFSSPSTYREGTPPHRLQIFIDVSAELLLLALMIGGCCAAVGLLQRRRSSVDWITAVIAGQWLVGLTAITVSAVIAAKAPTETLQPETDPSVFQLVAFLAALALLLLAGMFEVIGLVWLWQLRRFLQPTPATNEGRQ
jgi:hypothetical protein